MSKQITIKIEQRVKPIVLKAQSLTIKDEATLAQATELLSQTNVILDEVTEQRKADLEPYEVPAKEIKAQYDPTIKTLKQLVETLRINIGEFQTKMVNLRTEKELAITDRIGAGKGKLTLETAVKKLDQLDVPVEKVTTTTGSLTFRPKNTLKIVNPDLIPREYLLPDEARILKALEAGVEVAGCTIEIVQVPYNARRS